MGNIRVDLTNVVTIGLAAIIAVWLWNRGVDKFGHPALKA